MDDDENSERIKLIKDKTQMKDDSDSADSNSSSEQKQYLNLRGAFFVIFGFTVGSGIIVMPYVIRQLGIVAWVLSLVGVTLVQFSCSYILSLSTKRALEDHTDSVAIRDAFQMVSYTAYGQILRKVSVIAMYGVSLCVTISLLLLCASLLSDLLPVRNVAGDNSIRLWVTITILLLTPVMYLGTYSDLIVPAGIATFTVLISAVATVTNSLIYMFVVGSDNELPEKNRSDAGDNFLIPLGTMIFCTGQAYTIPNVTSVVKRRGLLIGPLLLVNMFILFTLGLAGFLPYLAFEDNVQPSIVSTFYSVLQNGTSDTDTAIFRGITVLIQVLMMTHLTMASVLAMNPIYLHLEETLKISRQFNYKRVLVRTSCMVGILLVCVAVPRFDVIISITGGIFFTLMGIILPIIIFTKLFEFKLVLKVFLYFSLGIAVLFMIGNVYFSIRKLVMK